MGNFTTVEKGVPNEAFHGTSMGGQQPISGAKISVYTYGTGGYGSAGLLLASTTTNANGYFSFPAGAYTCPQSNTPVYLIGTGGDAGYGTNMAAVTAAPLGACSGAPNETVVMNEVTTVALAYALSGYFTPFLGAGSGTPDQYDTFGGPSTVNGTATVYAKGMVLGNSYTAGLIAINSNGLAYANNGIITAEPLKVYSIANTLGACINSAGPTSTACSNLFTYTTSPGGTAPSDTMQAAVQIALYPYQNVTNLYNLAGTKPPFDADLSSAPSDWTIAVSFTSPMLGLGIDSDTMSTLDIDASNRVWFPSTASGHVGVAYLDPTTQSFSGPYNATNMVHPEQVAIDGSGYVWATDTQGSYISRYKTASPTSGYSGIAITSSGTTVPTKSYAMSVDAAGTVWVGLFDNSSSLYKLGFINSGMTTYSESAVALPANYIPYSITNDGSQAASGSITTNQPNLYFSLYNSAVTNSALFDYLSSSSTSVVQRNAVPDKVGQVTFNGYDLMGMLTYDNNASTSHLSDGICFPGEPINGVTNTSTLCATFTHARASYLGQGVAIDGIGSIWVADENNATVVQAPFQNYNTHSYVNSTRTGNTITGRVYNHNSSNGGTLTNPEGIGVDNEGNVWVSNAGCLGTGCTPGSFVLSELIGTASPTITPISGQIQNGAVPSTEPSY